MAQTVNDDYTICMITHENFLNAFYSLLGSCDYLGESLAYGHKNLSLSSFTIDKSKKITIDFINYSCLE